MELNTFKIVSENYKNQEKTPVCFRNIEKDE